MSASNHNSPKSASSGTVAVPDSSSEGKEDPAVLSDFSSIEQKIDSLLQKVTSLMINTPRVTLDVELVRQDVSALRECWKRGRIDDMTRRAVPRVNELRVRAYRCPRSGNDTKVWILVEVVTTAYRSVKVFELLGVHFIERKCPFAEYLAYPMPFSDLWDALDENITQYLRVTYAELTASTARLSDMDVSTTSETLTCGCLAPSSTHGGHGDSNICISRRLAQKMVLAINHMIQSIRFVEVYSIELGNY